MTTDNEKWDLIQEPMLCPFNGEPCASLNIPLNLFPIELQAELVLLAQQAKDSNEVLLKEAFLHTKCFIEYFKKLNSNYFKQVVDLVASLKE
jgi:hypothetical protein